jgi:polyisoprenyl-teichoic acid--peptidoglycan teichoic acid transferase
LKKRIIAWICVAAGILAITAGLFVTFRYFAEAKDYRKSLAVVREVPKPVEGSVKKEGAPQTAGTTANTGTAAVGQETAGPETLIAEESGQEMKGNIVNLLFLGTDRTDERDEWLKIYRTDTISLASINLDTKEINVLCIPRDTYAYLPVKQKVDKMGHAYAFGGNGEKGIKSTIAAVEHFVRYAKVDYYFCLDMEPIPEIVDSLGGVELDVELDMKTHGADLSKGQQLLDGKKAFDYIRWRYSGNGDIDRIKRQQKFFRAMYNKLKETDQILNAMKLVLKYNEYVKTNLSIKQMVALAALSNDIPQGALHYHTVPGSAKYINKISYWVPNEEKTEKLLRDIF